MRLVLLLVALALAVLGQNQTEQPTTSTEQVPAATPTAAEIEPTPTPVPTPTPTPAFVPAEPSEPVPEEPVPTPTPEPVPTPTFVPAEPAPEPALYLDVPEERLESCFRTFRHCVKGVLAASYGYERGSRENVWQFIKRRTTGCEAQLATLRRLDVGSDFPVGTDLGVETLQCITQIPKAN